MTSLTLRNTAIVVDSTCDPPPGFFEQEGIFLVPLTVHFGDETYRDQVDLTHDEFFAKLEASAVLPTTSQPTIAEFQRCYAEATATYEHVLSLHLSRKLQERRIFPAVDIERSSTRREELLLGPDIMQRVWLMRRMYAQMVSAPPGGAGMDQTVATEAILTRLDRAKNNQMFLENLTEEA